MVFRIKYIIGQINDRYEKHYSIHPIMGISITNMGKIHINNSIGTRSHSKQSRLFKITIYKTDNDYVSRYNYKANLFKQH
mgnify:CR=1 FL=1